MKGLIHAREPIWFWSPFSPETYGSEHPGQRWVPVWQPEVCKSGTDALFQCLEGVFHPRLPNLFEALGHRRRRSCDKGFEERPGDRFEATRTNRHGRLSPTLQESVPMARPTCVALFPWSSTSSMSPTITSGPGTTFGTPGLRVCCRGGVSNDCGWPLSKLCDLGRLHDRADGDCSND